MIKFSIITVTKNADATLDQAIASVAAQRYASFEYIIVDGASVDGTKEIVARYPNIITQFVSEQDQGIYDAMNKGIDLATGDFIYFLGADDYFVDENVLTDVANFLEAQSGCDFVYGGLEVRFPDGRVQEFLPPPPENALSFQVCGCLPHQASFVGRRAFATIGKFDTRYRIAGDYDWFLRVLTRRELTTRRIDRIVASYRIDGVSNRLEQSQAEVYTIQNNFLLYSEPEWVAERIRIFLRELRGQSRRGELLARSIGMRAHLFQGMSLLWLLLGYPFAIRFVPRSAAPWSMRRLERLQQKLLAQRVANDAFERELIRRRRATEI